MIKKCAALSLIPENHGKCIRIEELTRKSALNFNTNSATISHAEFQSYINTNYSSNYLEDVPVNLFTDLVTFYGGDYLIFPGITETGSYTLYSLLSAIYNWPDSGIHNHVKNNSMHASLLILNLSNAIAKRLGYKRYTAGNITEDAIFVPAEDELGVLQEALTFSQEEIQEILTKNEIAPEALEAFLLDINEPNLQNEHIQESPLLNRPILFHYGNYIVISPTTLSYALTNFIISQADLFQNKARVSNAYHSMIWNNTQLHLSQLGFNAIETPTIPDGVRDKIYRFDNDKLAYVQYSTDNSRSHQDRKQGIINDVLSKPEFAEHQFLDITLVSSMGEDSFFSFSKTDNSKSIGMPIHDFDTLIKLKDYSAIDLWNYSIAHEKQFSESTPVMASFLDVFKIFKENDDSFYISDENTDMQLYVEPGYATDLYQKAKLLSDEHSALRFFNNSDRLIYAPVVRKEVSSPVYYCPSDLGVKLELLVDGFFQSIWVSPTKSSDAIPSSARGLYYEVTDAIAYWLWQCQHLIKNDLESLGDTPISVTFNLNPEESFNPIERNFERDPSFSDHFNITVINNNSFNISIPESIIPYLYGADNEGERILLKHLLLGFNELLTLQQKPIIQNDRIFSIINEVAPLGVKKKVFILDTSDNLLLDPSNLEKHRYIQSYNVNVVLDNIVPELGALCPPTGNIIEKEDKTKLTRDIVMRVLLPKLSSTINQYQHKPLLKKLIGLNESLIRKREDLRLKTPTRIACFVSVEKQTVDLQEELSKLDLTTIAVRCLIEHIAAEPCTGNKIVSTTAIDELIAIMNQITTWGSLGDQIEYDLFDVQLSILPSRRVGTIKTLSSEIFDPYYASKSKEKVQGAIDTFNQCFPKHLELDTNNPPEYLENAFLSEFGLTFTRICEFINDLGIIAYQQSTPFAAILKSQLFQEINAHDHTYTEDEFNLGLDYLCLFNRGKVYKIPEGFDNIDISPWRFNRRLSLLRKPLVAVSNPDNPEDPIIHWGFRHLLSSRTHLFDQCMTNRLRVIEKGAIQKALGKLTQINGTNLVKSVLDELKNDQLIIDSEVFINTKSELKADKDKGDIDVLVIDQSSKTIYSLECKSMAPSRNIKEMVEEVNKLFGSDSKKGWIDKHVGRDEWLKNNLDQLGTKYKLDLSKYTVKSFFVTQEDMLTPYLKTRTLKLPFVSLPNLKEKGLEILK
ncbi:hypothetical protein GCM10010976_23780 [Bizionia arctica]|uniref:Uncharacterized protein n=1 Tax=Bizionia arctica TaxID=1495645 RepID=A0A917GN13_9FLAO|nr:hypothetical protein GCM10010976_23780 [Bizionia arctica]